VHLLSVIKLDPLMFLLLGSDIIPIPLQTPAKERYGTSLLTVN